jgi:hypothetical protein
LSGIRIDKTSPAIAITGVADGSSYLLGSAPVAGYTATDALSGIDGRNASLSGGNAIGSGTFVYTVDASDKAGNAGRMTATYRVVYAFGGFLPPLHDTSKPIRLGSTIPVKFRLADAAGAQVSAAHVRLQRQQFSNGEPVGDPIDVTEDNTPDSGEVFRFDAAEGQYIYNWSTKGLAPGSWQISVLMDDGTNRSILLSLKDK